MVVLFVIIFFVTTLSQAIWGKCLLTAIENMLRAKAGLNTYPESCIAHYGKWFGVNILFSNLIQKIDTMLFIGAIIIILKKQKNRTK